MLFDLEGTISNPKHRMGLLGKPSFQKAFKGDTVNIDVKLFMDSMKDQFEIVILTAKYISYKDIVLNWLKRNEINYNLLIMKDDKKIEDVEFKRGYIVNNCDNIVMAFDDVGKNCAMYSKYGIPSLRIVQKD